MGDDLTFNKDPQQKIDFDLIWAELKPALVLLDPSEVDLKDPIRKELVKELPILKSVFEMCKVVDEMVPDYKELLIGS